MENNKMEELLRDSLKPEIQADMALDAAVLDKIGAQAKTLRKEKVRKFPVGRLIPKVAAVVLAVMVAGIGTTYAASKILEQIRVTEHGISVGNENYVSDENLAEPWESVSVENLSEVQGGPEDKWTKKRVELVSGLYENTYYSYPDYLTAVSDTRFQSIFTNIPGKEQSVSYCVSDLGNDTWEYSLDSIFEYKEGRISANQSVMEGNVAKDAAFSIAMQKTGNVRAYVNVQGNEYTLVDDMGYAEKNGENCTIVLLSCKEFQGYIAFYGLSEQSIREVLDTLTVKFEDIYEGVEEICEGAGDEESAGDEGSAGDEESVADEGNVAEVSEDGAE